MRSYRQRHVRYMKPVPPPPPRRLHSSVPFFAVSFVLTVEVGLWLISLGLFCEAEKGVTAARHAEA